MGLGAVLLSGFFLAFLLFLMVSKRGSFTYTRVPVPIDFRRCADVDKARLSDATPIR